MARPVKDIRRKGGTLVDRKRDVAGSANPRVKELASLEGGRTPKLVKR